MHTTYADIRRSRNSSQSARLPLFCAVADGLGIHQHSAWSANVAVSTLVGSFVDAYTNMAPESDWEFAISDAALLLHNAFDRAEVLYKAAMAAVVESTSGRFSFDGATTLAGVWMAENFIGIVSVGDSFVVATRADGSCALILGADKIREYANETDVFASEGPNTLDQRTVMIVCDPQIVSVVLSTDGLAEVALAPGTHSTDIVAHPGFFLELYGRLQGGAIDGAKLTQLVAKMGERTTDDTTLVVAWR